MRWMAWRAAAHYASGLASSAVTMSSAASSASMQGLTLVHFSAQPEPFWYAKHTL